MAPNNNDTNPLRYPPSTATPTPMHSLELKAAARGFSAYCEAELERRRNGEEGFNAALYDKAVQLVLRKLGAVEEESVS